VGDLDLLDVVGGALHGVEEERRVEFDGDATVGPADFDLLTANLGRGTDQPLTLAQLADIQAFAATVPEPGALSLAFTAAATLLLPRRRCRQ